MPHRARSDSASVVSENPIGANIQDADYDFSNLEDNVRWIENTVNLDTDSLPIPRPLLD